MNNIEREYAIKVLEEYKEKLEELSDNIEFNSTILGFAVCALLLSYNVVENKIFDIILKSIGYGMGCENIKNIIINSMKASHLESDIRRVEYAIGYSLEKEKKLELK